MSATRISVLAQKHQLKNYINGAVNANLLGDATFLAPIVRTGSLVNTVWKYDRTKPFRIPETRRALGGKATQVDFGGTTEDITLETHALDTGIDILAERDEEIIMNLRSQSDMAASLAGLAHFKSVRTTIAGAVSSTTLTISSDDPIAIFDAKIKSILLSCGSYAPAVKIRFLWGYEAALKVLNDAQVISRISGGATRDTPAVATLDSIAKMLVLQGTEHRICTAIEDTGEFGSGTESRAFVGDNEVLIAAVAPNPNKQDPSAFKTLWYGSDGMQQGFYKSEDGRSEYVKLDWAMKIYTANAGAAYKYTVQA